MEMSKTRSNCISQCLYKMLTLCSFLICVISQVTSVHIPKFEVPSPESKYRLGRSAVLRCTVTNIGGRTIIWKKLSDPFPISIGANKFNPSNKYRIKQDGDSWLLTIKKLDRGDAGDYECRASGRGNHAVTISLIIPGEGDTHFSPTDTDLFAALTETVILPCKVNNLKKFKSAYQVAWLDQKGNVISLRKRVINGDQRLRIIHTAREEWSLQIKKLRDEDFGRYTCLVNSNPVISRSVLLKNTGPSLSPPFLNLAKKKYDKKEGESVDLECLFQGFPVPVVTWYRRIKVGTRRVKEVLSHKGMMLKLTDIKPGDSGDYYCTGKNGVQPLSRGKIKLNVEAKPTTIPPPTTPFVPTGPAGARVKLVVERIGQRKGKDAYLECMGIGIPYPTVYWKRHKSVIHNDFQHITSHTKHNEFTAHSKLHIRYVGTSNYGDYECVAANSLGSDVAIVELYETQN